MIREFIFDGKIFSFENYLSRAPRKETEEVSRYNLGNNLISKINEQLHKSESKIKRATLTVAAGLVLASSTPTIPVGEVQQRYTTYENIPTLEEQLLNNAQDSYNFETNFEDSYRGLEYQL